jgi:hypothetical protein
MPDVIRRVDYFHTTIRDRPGASYEILSQLSELGLNLVAFTAIPTGPTHTQLTLFPEDSGRMAYLASRAGMKLDGPHQAFLVQGDDKLGALTGIHEALYRADVNVYASSGVTDGKGTFGYLIYVRPESYDRAAEALGV